MQSFTVEELNDGVRVWGRSVSAGGGECVPIIPLHCIVGVTPGVDLGEKKLLFGRKRRGAASPPSSRAAPERQWAALLKMTRAELEKLAKEPA